MDNLRTKDIIKNIRNKNFLIYYQPIINPTNNEIVGLEALLRMKLNNRIILPIDFLKYIEKYNFLEEISIWILNKVLKDYEKIISFLSFKHNKKYISINLTFKEIESETFIDKLKKIVENFGLIDKKICIEISERIKLKNLNKALKNLNKLKEMGFIIAIDDFGMDYSNLFLLCEIPFDILKIDKYFCNKILEYPYKFFVLKILHEFNNLTNKSLIFEGIDNEIDFLYLKNLNFKNYFIQGFIYSKPKFFNF